MKFVFWQNVISIHQSAFIKALSKENDVTLVAQEELDALRSKEGWTVPSMGRSRVIVNPDDETMATLLDQRDTEHVFSGINGFPMVYRAFKEASRRGLKVSVMAEPYEWAGIKGLFRRMMYSWLILRYGKCIKHFFATGNMGVTCYRKAGMPAEKLHQWGYFTELNSPLEIREETRSKPNMIFVGKIDDRKYILTLARYAAELSGLFNRFYIIGTGPLEDELRTIIRKTPNIDFIGPVLNKEVRSYLSMCDLLVLPSRFDGWGAVVNEALSAGCRVLCSDACGSESLLDNNLRGGTFQSENDNDLKNKLIAWLSKDTLSRQERMSISAWARKCISGEAASEYFLTLLSDSQTEVPWLTPPYMLTKVNIIYVGRIDCNKNIIGILKHLHEFGDNLGVISIVGDGPMMDELELLSQKDCRIRLYGRLSNEESQKMMARHDILLLPSLYDGWGAVVNEALARGTRVLCSKACGAAILLDGEKRGEVFSRNNFTAIIRKNCNLGHLDDMKRADIVDWAKEHISGNVAADYFKSTLRGERPDAPWITQC